MSLFWSSRGWNPGVIPAQSGVKDDSKPEYSGVLTESRKVAKVVILALLLARAKKTVKNVRDPAFSANFQD